MHLLGQKFYFATFERGGGVCISFSRNNPLRTNLSHNSCVAFFGFCYAGRADETHDAPSVDKGRVNMQLQNKMGKKLCM